MRGAIINAKALADLFASTNFVYQFGNATVNNLVTGSNITLTVNQQSGGSLSINGGTLTVARNYVVSSFGSGNYNGVYTLTNTLSASLTGLGAAFGWYKTNNPAKFMVQLGGANTNVFYLLKTANTLSYYANTSNGVSGTWSPTGSVVVSNGVGMVFNGVLDFSSGGSGSYLPNSFNGAVGGNFNVMLTNALSAQVMTLYHTNGLLVGTSQP